MSLDRFHEPRTDAPQNISQAAPSRAAHPLFSKVLRLAALAIVELSGCQKSPEETQAEAKAAAEEANKAEQRAIQTIHDFEQRANGIHAEVQTATAELAKYGIHPFSLNKEDLKNLAALVTESKTAEEAKEKVIKYLESQFFGKKILGTLQKGPEKDWPERAFISADSNVFIADFKNGTSLEIDALKDYPAVAISNMNTDKSTLPFSVGWQYEAGYKDHDGKEVYGSDNFRFNLQDLKTNRTYSRTDNGEGVDNSSYDLTTYISDIVGSIRTYDPTTHHFTTDLEFAVGSSIYSRDLSPSQAAAQNLIHSGILVHELKLSR